MTHFKNRQLAGHPNMGREMIPRFGDDCLCFGGTSRRSWSTNVSDIKGFKSK